MKMLLVTVLAALLLYATAFAAEKVYVPHTFYLYEAACFSSAAAGRFSARDIEIIERDGDWILAEIDGTAGWVNLLYSPAICALDRFFAPLGRNISVFYKNLDTGFTYIHNPERVFFAASLSKSNHALYTFLLAERGMLPMYDIHVFSPSDHWGGTGILRFEDFGKELTTRDLLGLSIRESDNAAFRMLLRLTENAEFSYRDFVEEIGAEPRFIRDTFSQNTNARDAGLFMYEIFNYIEGGGLFAPYFRYDLMNTAMTSHPHFTRWEGSNGWGDNGAGTPVSVQMLRSYYPLARKYGWAGGAFHDAGIIYAPSPYILVVLSNRERGAHAVFEEISWFVQDFNHRTFVSPTPLDAPPKGPENYGGNSTRIAGRRGGFRLSVPVFAEYFEKGNEVREKLLFKDILKGKN